MALPWIALSWYSKSFTHSISLDPADTVNSPEIVSLGGAARKACPLTAATMLMIGCCQMIQLRQRAGSTTNITFSNPTVKDASAAFVRACAVGLPVYAALKVGGFLVAFVLLLAFASGLPTLIENTALSKAAQERFGQKKLTIALLVAVVSLGFLGINTPWDEAPFMGYVALLVSVFIVRPPFVGQFGSASAGLGFTAPEESASSLGQKPSGSGLPPADSNGAILSIISGVLLAFVSFVFSGPFSFAALEVVFPPVISALLAASFVYLHPTSIRSPRKFGLVLGTGAAAVLCSPPPRDGVFIAYVARCMLAGISFAVARFDDRHLRLTAHSHTHHHHSHSPAGTSKLTKLVLHYSEPYPLLYSILQESDSRRIFYFMRCVVSIRQNSR